MLPTYPERFTGTKYRLSAWARRLERRGFEVELAPPMSDAHAVRLSNDWSPRARTEYHLRMLSGRLAALGRAGRIDAAVVHINDLPFWDYGPPFVAAALGRLAGRVILDLDDLPLVGGAAELGPKARAVGRAVDGLTLGNRRLPACYPGRPWWYVPTCVEPAEWQVPDRAARAGPPVLGWVGTPGNLRNLAPLAPALAEVCRRHDARLRVVCSEPADLPGVPEEFVRWSAEREQEDLVPVDVGLAPLLDEPKQRYTCGLKALQYMAGGLPVVASPVGSFPEIVREGETGMLATSPEEWAAALDRLLGDRDLRLRLGAAGRRAVEERWSFAKHEASFENALRGVGPDGA
jgi:glycosyltransferase involved in cell wall biosynthesis